MKASEEFWDAIIHSGSIVVECEFCGRIYFASDEECNFNEGELEDLKAKSKINPEKYIDQGGMIRYGYLLGKQAVYDCPCNTVAKYEQFIWDHRHIILRYLKDRIDLNLKDAQQEKKIADEVKEV